MENKSKFFENTFVINISILVFLILIFFLSCSVRNKIIETKNIVSYKIDSLQTELGLLEISNNKNDRTLLESLQELTYLSNLTNKQKVLDKQTVEIKKLNSKIQTLEKKR